MVEVNKNSKFKSSGELIRYELNPLTFIEYSNF